MIGWPKNKNGFAFQKPDFPKARHIHINRIPHKISGAHCLREWQDRGGEEGRKSGHKTWSLCMAQYIPWKLTHAVST